MKDKVLDKIFSDNNNIAQYISFSPQKKTPNYIHIKNNKIFKSNKEAITNLISSASSKAVNIRSFSPTKMKGNKLIYNKGINNINEILEIIQLNQENGFFSIVNENIDINDGGVSGVIFKDIIEFSPKDTPKCVEKSGVCSLPKDIGYKLLKTVYGFEPECNYPENFRVEFSIHPKKQGILNKHTIIWEVEEYDSNLNQHNIKIKWPNNFSKFIGDKTFGLLLADILGFKVPYTTVMARNTPPFNFGEKTGSNEKWLRTCPINKVPGKFFSGFGWTDPFNLMNEEEKIGSKDINIAALLSQDAVEALYSGASIISEQETEDIIEGVKGCGDSFMVGKQNPEDLPKDLIVKIQNTNNQFRQFNDLLGNISIEWVYDGEFIWIVQLNQLKSKSTRNIIVEGSPERYISFNVERGLEELRTLISEIKDNNIGINLIGNVGITSHFGDLLRIQKIPSLLNY